MDPHHHSRLLAYGHGDTTAIAIATVCDDHRTDLPPIPRQVCPMAVRHTHLLHPASHEVVGQRQSPVVPRATGLAQATGIDQEEPSRRTRHGRGGRLRHGDELAEQPQQPVVTGAQALAPRGLGDIRQAAQYRPRPEAAGRQRPQHIRQQTAQQIVWGGEDPDALERFSPGPARQGLAGKRGTTSVVQASSISESDGDVTRPWV